MESYRKRLIWRIRGCYGLIVLMLILMVVVGELSGGMLLGSRDMTQTAETVSRLLFFGGLIAIFVRLYRLKKLLQSPRQQKEQEILEADERRQMIHDRSGGLAMDALLVLMAAAVFALAWVNMAAFYTALYSLLAGLALKGGLHWYYSKRY